ncbi:MAG TPA: RNA polymerase factor sigma-54 [Parachlamydiaceae bacterium]|nr:RNA polymerase factor sigma-54 [Parachlamydiaceae bacterium]
MSNSLSFELQQKPGQNIKQLQRLIMSRQMQQAIHFLQMPIMELTPLIDMELEQNPVLEYSKEEGEELEVDSDLKQLEEDNIEELTDGDSIPEKELSFEEGDFEIMRRLDEDFRDHFSESGNGPVQCTSEQEELQTFLESSITSEETLFEHLMQQANEAFEDKKILAIAESIIGNFDRGGFLNTSFEELALLQSCDVEDVKKVLKVIQTFDPIGIGARSLKESLLIQLLSQGKNGTLAHRIVEGYFDDLLHNRIPNIKKGLHCTAEEIGEAVDNDIACLDLHPGTQLSRDITSFIVPDVTMREEEDELIVAINDDSMPRLRLNTRYMRMLDDPALPMETREFIKQKIVSAKWLLRNIMQRNSTLERIAQSLAKWQRNFFLNPDGKLVPLTMHVLAEELEVHESTIARAVSGKYIDTPRGILALRSFFTSGLTSSAGADISSKTARDLLEDIIAGENKEHPYSDEAISAMIKENGIQCARRTVAKYRVALKIGTAQQRRKF